jgi:hypothetical protein
MTTKDTKRFIRIDVDDQLWRAFKDKIRAQGSSITRTLTGFINDFVAAPTEAVKRNAPWTGIKPAVDTLSFDEVEEVNEAEAALQARLASRDSNRTEPVAEQVRRDEVPAVYSEAAAADLTQRVDETDPEQLAAVIKELVEAQVAQFLARTAGARAVLGSGMTTTSTSAPTIMTTLSSPEVRIDDLPRSKKPMGGVGCSLCSCEAFLIKEGAPSMCGECGHFRVQHYGS